MRLVIPLLVLLVLGAHLPDPAFAQRRGAARTTQRQRTMVVVHKAWPLKRAQRAAIVRVPRAPLAAHPTVFLAPVVFGSAALKTLPTRDHLVWEDSEVLSKADDWTAFTLQCGTRGKQLYLEISAGRIQFDWAEVVFDNGDAQVIDFAEKLHGPGFFPLLDFRDGRKVDHVRMLARARTREAKLVLRLAR